MFKDEYLLQQIWKLNWEPRWIHFNCELKPHLFFITKDSINAIATHMRCIAPGKYSSTPIKQPPSGKWIVRAVASNRQTEALALVMFFVFVVYSHHKHPKYPEGELTMHKHCFNHKFFNVIASVIIFFWLRPLIRTLIFSLSLWCPYLPCSIAIFSFFSLFPTEPRWTSPLTKISFPVSPSKIHNLNSSFAFTGSWKMIFASFVIFMLVHGGTVRFPIFFDNLFHISPVSIIDLRWKIFSKMYLWWSTSDLLITWYVPSSVGVQYKT